MIHPNNGRGPSCHSSAARDEGRWIDRSGFAPEEVAVLAIMRRIFLSHAAPPVHSRFGPLACAVELFGADGGRICIRTVAFTCAMRSQRTSAFRFSNPDCPVCLQRLSDCEHHLMEILRATRRADGAAARVHALILCEGHSAEGVLAAARNLARALSDHLEAPCR